jgi:SAM-dependent methyltransferase
MCNHSIVLDLGCGTGQYLSYTSAAKMAIGVDRSKNMLDFCRSHHKNKTPLFLADAVRLPFVASSFDFIYSIGMAEYVHLPTVLEECHTILRPGGLLLLETSNRFGGRKIVSHWMHRRKYGVAQATYYSRKQLRTMFEDARFVVQDIIMNDGLIYLPAALQQIIGKSMFRMIERLTRSLPYNPFSQNMVVVASRS